MGTTLMPPFASGPRDRDQAMLALVEANRVRLRRASLMRWMQGQSPAESHERAAELVLDSDPVLHSMLVVKLLERVQRVGPAQAERMVTCADIAPARTVGALTPRQRAGLAALLRLRVDQLSHHARSSTKR